jgi:S1-C subfamily serine protease
MTPMRTPNLLRLIAAAGSGLLLAMPAAADLAEDLAQMRTSEAQRVETLAQAARATVCIFGDRASTGGGSGVIIDPAGYGLTNFHVVAEFVESGGFGGLNDGRLYPLTVLGIDPGGDVAMFKLEGRESFPFAPLGDSDALRVGQWVAALGNPFLLAEDYTPTLTLGVVSGVHRYQEGQENALEYADCIQVSTSINPGNSGGPLFDLAGNVVGINGRASFEERGRVNVGLGYAISIRQIERFIPSLRAGIMTLHGTLGATVRRAGDDLIFDAIQELSPAQKAGVQLGDKLLAVDGRPVRTPNEYNNAIAVLPANWPVVLLVQRGSATPVELSARLEPLPVRLGGPLLPKPASNRAAVRWLIAKARSAAPELAKTDRPLAVRISLAGGDEVACTVAPADESGTKDTGDCAAAQEWAGVIRLLADEEFAESVRAIGGDLVDGAIVSVVERIVDGRIERWYFDERTRRLTGYTVGTETNAAEIRWAEVADGDAYRWQRTGGEAGVVTLRIAPDTEGGS